MTKSPKHSYSSTGTYETCAHKYEQIIHLRIPEYQDTDNAQNIRGSEMHEEFETCVNEDTDYSDPQYQWILDRFRGRTGLKIAEMQLAINRAWKPCDYKDKNAWYRGKIDFTTINGTHAWVDDLKTGKRRFKSPGDELRWLQDRHVHGRAPLKEDVKYLPDPDDYVLANARQASDYALMIFAHFPEIQTQDFSFVWSDVKGVDFDTFSFERGRDMKNLLKTMLYLPTKIEKSIKTDSWEPTPNFLCKGWCSVVGCTHWQPKPEYRR